MKFNVCASSQHLDEYSNILDKYGLFNKDYDKTGSLKKGTIEFNDLDTFMSFAKEINHMIIVGHKDLHFVNDDDTDLTSLEIYDHWRE